MADEPKIGFRRDVLHVLADRCFSCHGPDANSRQAELRIDVRDAAVEHGAIVPGDPDASELIRRILSTDPDEMMPPPDAKKKPISDAEKQTLVKWVQQGAEYKPHWAFVPPEKAPLPDAAAEAPRNPIDRFVRARLAQERLSPSPPADKTTLVRRLSLDLTGLPPSAAEVERFVASDDDGAYGKLVDQLLASRHFGERMALDWLDAARYADSNGYSIDGGRHMWLWRDWVIDAFNRNMPYDEFLRKQLAGDLLPDRTDEQLIATGFQRNNMNTFEGGTIPEENLTNYNVDRVKTLGEAVLGLTLGCAQCHDHKFDPITQRDFYRFYAYFNSLSDMGLDGKLGLNSRPMFEAKTVLVTKEAPELKREIKRLKRQLANPDPAKVADWEAKIRAELALRGKGMTLEPVELKRVSTPNSGEGFEIDPPRFVHFSHANEMAGYDILTKLPQVDRPITGVRIVFHRDPGAPGNGYGYGTLPDPPIPWGAKDGPGSSAFAQVHPAKSPEVGRFVLTTFSASAESVPSDQVNLHKLLRVRRVTANTWLTEYRPENVLDTRNENGWSPAKTHDGPAHITLTFDKPIDPAATPNMTVLLNFGHGRYLIPVRFEILALTGNDDGSDLPDGIIAIVQKSPEDRTADENSQVIQHFAEHSPAAWRDRITLANLEERLAVLTEKHSTMVMDVAEKPRPTFILTRGDYTQPTEEVSAGTPSVLPVPPSGASPDRLGLAQWITMRKNPLTARVYVNRVWQLLFGVGLVRTAADLGAQGEFPSHPELLDWLAVDFMDNGWDVKRLVRQIVTSASYRQSSFTTAELLSRDPDNRLLARGPRFRLPAEFVRDTALKTSGLLVDRIGGPSVNPYTPGDLWREVSHYGSTDATAQTFVQDHGEKLYRRSLYTFWKRTLPPPNMVAFDAPNRETCTVSRSSTTTPLQALVLLNDVQFVEASRAFAERIIASSDEDADRLRWAILECLSRPGSDEEVAVLQKALERERVRYAANESAAHAYLAAGESLRNEEIPVCEHAAWSQVAALLLNSSEAFTRN